MTYIERIVNADTNQITEQPYTEEQLAEVDAAQKKLKEMQEAEATKATEKAALLAKLGITDDEAKLLLS
jgi:hypothetical protein